MSAPIVGESRPRVAGRMSGRSPAILLVVPGFIAAAKPPRVVVPAVALRAP